MDLPQIEKQTNAFLWCGVCSCFDFTRVFTATRFFLFCPPYLIGGVWVLGLYFSIAQNACQKEEKTFKEKEKIKRKRNFFDFFCKA